jgi:hypothetical protein
MYALWETLVTGFGTVLIVIAVALLIGACVLVWWTRKID